ncbi:Ent-kaur-16-ene synthase, chloroplastic-like protein [Tanacetum coccineum]
MKNGSVLNSPSATAAALTCNQNVDYLHYLTSLLEKFGDAVPTVYPLDLYFRLSMVDTLERLGITSHFLVEIKNVLGLEGRANIQGRGHLCSSLLDIKGQWLSSLLSSGGVSDITDYQSRGNSFWRTKHEGRRYS